jgi:hypothetical protein
MNRYVRLIDENGLFVEDAFVEELTPLTIETLCPPGFYRPKWDGEKWIEGLTQDQIDEIKNVPQVPSIEDRLTAAEGVIMEVLEMMAM